MSSAYCVHCREERELRIETRTEVFDVRGEATTTETNVAVCTQCGTELFLEELEEGNLRRAFDSYRANHQMLTAGEIRAIRERYQLAQGELAALLGWGRVTISRYENGAVQSRGHDQTLKLLRNPNYVRQLLEQAGSGFSRSLRDKLAAQVDTLERRSASHSVRACIAALLDSGEPSLLNGFRRFDLETTHQVATFLASSVGHFFESKATKLLWYADFLAFKSQSRSITGCAYVAAKYGPVPDHFRLLFDEMVESGILDTDEISFRSRDGESFTKDLYRPAVEPATDRLSRLEVKCLQAVAEEFGDLSSNKTIDRAHGEPAYSSVFQEGEPWKVIPYDLAKTLSLEAVTD